MKRFDLQSTCTLVVAHCITEGGGGGGGYKRHFTEFADLCTSQIDTNTVNRQLNLKHLNLVSCEENIIFSQQINVSGTLEKRSFSGVITSQNK